MKKKLLNWYKKNKRSLPWRNTRNPYKIWVSEIILQQTQIKTGINYYNKFIESFPNIDILAKSTDKDILIVWQGLGYYNRAINMLHAAKYIAMKHNSIFPGTYNEIIKLKGVGDYTAAAISSICFDEHRAVLDGNVFRLLSRLFNIKSNINSTNGRKEFYKVAINILPLKNPGEFNQAMMDFGSLHCKQTNPLCHSCPLKKECLAFRLDLIAQRPQKKKLNKKKERHLNYLFMQNGDRFIIQKRGRHDIWQKLYELPLIETEMMATKNIIINHEYLQKFKITSIEKEHNIKHLLSHQKLNILFWKIELKTINTSKKAIKTCDINLYPFPKPIKKYFEIKYFNI